MDAWNNEKFEERKNRSFRSSFFLLLLWRANLLFERLIARARGRGREIEGREIHRQRDTEVERYTER